MLETPERPLDGPHPDSAIDDGPLSLCGLSVLSGAPLSLWAPPGVETRVHSLPECRTAPIVGIDTPAPTTELQLCLAPQRLVVIGRSSGRSPVPYLDPAYRATQVLPDSGQSVLGGRGDDILVSRAHFTLRAAVGGGIVLTNGVPRVDGGIRSPLNGTYLVAPVFRRLSPGEELLIEPGADVTIQLPNRCLLKLAAR